MSVTRLFVIILVVGSTLIGCTSKHMRPVPPDTQLSAPLENEAMVIFMRPSSFGGAIQSSVFDVTTEENVLVGIVSASMKVGYRTEPGEHLFMVVSESADFMKADLAAGKVYYALVTPRPGWGRARFSLKPIHKDELKSDNFATWNEKCDLYENSDSAFEWARNNMPSIQSKRESYYQKWMSKPEEERPFLKRDDGM